MYEFSPTRDQERVLERVRALMDELVYPHESQSVPHRGLPRDLLRQLQARVKAEGSGQPTCRPRPAAWAWATSPWA